MPDSNLKKLHELEEVVVEPEFDRELASEIFENSPDAIVIVDRRGIIRFVNRPTELLFGYHRMDLRGKEVKILIPEGVQDKHDDHIKGYMEEPRVRPMGMGMTLHGVTKDGREIEVQINLSPLVTRYGQYVAANIRKRRT